MAIATGLGAVRTSADRWGIGLYSNDDRYRYWFRLVSFRPS